MKVKRFNNIWAMGLILFGVLLIAFYVAKIFFPQFIVGVAETPSIVKFGNYVDSHKWANILYNLFLGFISGYIYCCACCRVKVLSIYNCLILFGFLLVGLLFQIFQPTLYQPFNYTMLVIMPFLMCVVNKNVNSKTFASMATCFSIDIMAQALSVVIRNIIPLASNVNSATITILLIDGIIWRILLYLFFISKNNKKEN